MTEVGDDEVRRCPTCQGRDRHTVDMVCMTCGRDYMPDDGSDETGPGTGWLRLLGLWREQAKQMEAERDALRDEVIDLRRRLATAKDDGKTEMAQYLLRIADEIKARRR